DPAGHVHERRAGVYRKGRGPRGREGTEELALPQQAAGVRRVGYRPRRLAQIPGDVHALAVRAHRVVVDLVQALPGAVAQPLRPELDSRSGVVGHRGEVRIDLRRGRAIADHEYRGTVRA